MELLNYKNVDWTPSVTLSPNKIDIHWSNIPVTIEGMNKFNELVELCERKIGKENRIIWTPSTGIKKNGPFDRYDIESTSDAIWLTIYYRCRVARVSFRNWKPEENGGIGGKDAFREFCKIMKTFDVKVKDWEIKNKEKALKIKSEIPSPKITINPSYWRKELNNVHHLDLNSSYLSGMKEFIPEWGPALDYMYERRKENKTMKAVMVMTCGWMQSANFYDAKLAHVAKAGIEWNNKHILDLADKLIESGREIIGFNTDGIWYQGDIYHDSNEGVGLGKWKNDHLNCKFRAKSNGSYEYICDGKYEPVVRGLTTLDTTKDRKDWEWGDIFGGKVIEFSWDKDIERVEVI